MSMHFRSWFMGFALVGALAGTAGAVLVWLLVTSPLTAARFLAGGF